MIKLNELVTQIENYKNRLIAIRQEIAMLVDDKNDDSEKIIELINEYKSILKESAKLEKARIVSEVLTTVTPSSKSSLLEARLDLESLSELNHFYTCIIQSLQHAKKESLAISLIDDDMENLQESSEIITKRISKRYAEVTVIDIQPEDYELEEEPKEVKQVTKKESYESKMGLDENKINILEKEYANKPRMSDPSCPLSNWSKRDRLDAVIASSNGDLSKVMTWLSYNKMEVPIFIVRRYIDNNYFSMQPGDYYDPEAASRHM